MSLLQAMPKLPSPKPQPKKGVPSTLFLPSEGSWYFLVGATVNGYPAGTVFGPYTSLPDAFAGRDRCEVGAYNQSGLDAALIGLRRMQPALRLAA